MLDEFKANKNNSIIVTDVYSIDQGKRFMTL